MALDASPRNWAKAIPKPVSAKAQAAAAHAARIKHIDSTEVDPEEAQANAAQVTVGYTVRQYQLLYPIKPVNDHGEACFALESGKLFRVGNLKEDAPVVDKYSIPRGSTVLLAYGRNYSMQKHYQVE